MKTLRSFWFFIVIFVLFGCRHKDEMVVRNVWGYIQEHPDSALTVLDKYKVDDFRSRRIRAEYALLKSMALDKNHIDLTSDSLIRPALLFYEIKGTEREKMLSWYYLGRVQANAREYNDAIVSIIQAEDYSRHTGDNYQLGLIHMAKENIYSNCHNHSEAIQEAIKGLKVFDGMGNTVQASYAKRKLALAYLATKDFHHADSLLLDLIDNKRLDSVFVARCIFDYAWSQTLQEHYSEALEYYNLGIEGYNGRMVAHQAGMYAVTEYYVGQPSIGDAIKEQLASIPSERKTYLFICYHRSKMLGRYADAMNYERELIAMEDSIATQTMEQSIIKTQRDYCQKSSEVFRLQSERRKLTVIVILSGSLLLAILCIVLFWHIRKKHRQKLEGIMASLEEAKSLLNEANDENAVLNDQLAVARKQYVATFKKRFSKIAHLSETYYRTSGSKDARDTVYREVRDLSSFITQDVRTYRQLEKSVNASLSQAMSLYRKEYPGLEETDYRFVCYLMAGFPASTISLLLGITANNVYVRKSRLLETLRTDTAEDKELFVLAIE